MQHFKLADQDEQEITVGAVLKLAMKTGCIASLLDRSNDFIIRILT